MAINYVTAMVEFCREKNISLTLTVLEKFQTFFFSLTLQK